MKLLYFAWLRARIGLAEEEIAPPPEVTNVEELLQWLTSRGERYRAALERPEAVRVAVNFDYVGRDHPVKEGDEVALFPPVTGG